MFSMDQIGSSPTAATTRHARSFAALRISPAGSRSAHARKPAQVQVQPPPPSFTLDPSLRSGFRHAAQTPRKRLKLESNRRRQIFVEPVLTSRLDLYAVPRRTMRARDRVGSAASTRLRPACLAR